MSNSADRVEVFSGVQRRRRYSLDQKLAVLAEASQPGMSISYVARRHGIYMDASCLAKSLSDDDQRSRADCGAWM
jgi:transposase